MVKVCVSVVKVCVSVVKVCVSVVKIIRNTRRIPAVKICVSAFLGSFHKNRIQFIY